MFTLRGRRRAGFTLTEMLIVIAIIAVLLGLLVPALSGVFAGGRMTESMNKMKQIGTWMKLYGSDNQDWIVPSRFDYRCPDGVDCYSGQVRKVADSYASYGESRGTWTDIIWTLYCEDRVPAAADWDGTGTPVQRYRVDAPPSAIYSVDSSFDNPFRSSVPNSEVSLSGDGVPVPYGTGARATDVPGFFAANNFFDADRKDADGGGTPVFPEGSKRGFWSFGQMKFAERSIYLIDSFAGETIDPTFDNYDPADGNSEIDFRYAENCIILCLDGHSEPLAAWETADTPPTGHPNRISVGGFRVNELNER